MNYCGDLQIQYDQMLKTLVNNPTLFRTDEYDVYFNQDFFQSTVVDKMNEFDRKAYLDGAGSELKEHIRNGKTIPPSMSSVGSSSRFCYLSLKDSDFSVFDIKNPSIQRRFEEKMPVVKGTPPHLDCYLEDSGMPICFECKCHEQFDNYGIELSQSYFAQDRLVTKIDESYFMGNTFKKDKNGVTRCYKVISPSFVGLPNNPRFDIKQCLTHIMGIQARLKKENKSNARLIYYYFIPCETKKHSELNKVIQTLYEEIKTVFSSRFIKNYASNIQFDLYVQFSDTVETANKNNTVKII